MSFANEVQDAWLRFGRQMQQVMPGSESAVEFARQAFIAGWSAKSAAAPVSDAKVEALEAAHEFLDRDLLGPRGRPGLTPVFTTAERDALDTPCEGQMIVNRDIHRLEIWFEGAWRLVDSL